MAMTGVGGLLFVLSGGRPGPSGEGLTLTPLMATVGPSTLESIYQTPVPVADGRWLSIVIHDSGRAADSPDTLEAEARARKLKGLGYHFVIGNGNGMEDGELHIGARWLKQVPGAHASGADADWYNLNAVGICLVGDGDRQRFTPAQMERLSQLVDSLCHELKVDPAKVVLHRDIARTTSPGRLFPESAFRSAIVGAR
jgi:hypothetical protein